MDKFLVITQNVGEASTVEFITNSREFAEKIKDYYNTENPDNKFNDPCFAWVEEVTK